MRPQRLLTAAAVCIFMFTAAFGAYAMNNEKTANGISAASYDSNELAEYAAQIAEAVNSERAAHGLPPVKLSPELSDAANIRAKEIEDSFSHTRPDGSSCFSAMTDLGITYSSAAENIAYGQKSPQSVMNAWMNSSGHRANILDPNMEYIGVGVAYENGTYYWTQFFAASDVLTAEETTVNTVHETETPEPAETTAPKPETETPEPAETTAPKPETETPESAETTAPKPETETPEPAETTAPKTETEAPKPAETTAPETSSQIPCETTCVRYPNGYISCTPVTPCETQCVQNSDGSISCTPSTPCETQCVQNSDGSISCTPSTPCGTQQCPSAPNCSTGCPSGNSCNTGNSGTPSCGGTSSSNSSSCPLQSGSQGNNVLEWLLPQIFNSGSCSAPSSNSNSGSGSCNSGNSGNSGSGSCNSSSSCGGNSRTSGNYDSSNPYFVGIIDNSGGSSCWGN